MVLGVAGEHAAYSKYGQPFKHSALVLDQDDDYKWPALPKMQFQTAVS
jgi:hypothetical protein